MPKNETKIAHSSNTVTNTYRCRGGQQGSVQQGSAQRRGSHQGRETSPGHSPAGARPNRRAMATGNGAGEDGHGDGALTTKTAIWTGAGEDDDGDGERLGKTAMETGNGAGIWSSDWKRRFLVSTKKMDKLN
ncbi:unnamed protein product [Linum trigynum]|uniref:Uncharacterized protein n=1 Tax=Linum trigynum TaxID=586398 RepID=A0AAV2DU62_9ROSI